MAPGLLDAERDTLAPAVLVTSGWAVLYYLFLQCGPIARLISPDRTLVVLEMSAKTVHEVRLLARSQGVTPPYAGTF